MKLLNQRRGPKGNVVTTWRNTAGRREVIVIPAGAYHEGTIARIKQSLEAQEGRKP